MIVFEDQLARIVEVLPSVTVGTVTKSIKFDWGTETVLANYLTLAGTDAFPLIWLEEGEDNNDLREPNVKRNARIIILHQSQQPEQFNPYQHEYDYKIILQPILDNLLKALSQSGISRYSDNNFRTQRVKNYSMKEIDKSLVYVCNAIVFNAEITFSGVSSCIKENIFN
jgi:hypothetical protein